ncbi:MAG TPA: cupin [Burkholderiaceae bacterium]|nr:cupin [Burkholderiaceae bacterium]
MTALTVFDEHGARLSQLSEPAPIAAQLADLGIEFARWPAAMLPHDADLQAVLAAHAQPVARLGERHPIRSMDLVSLRPDHPDRAALRQRFLREHVHDDHEVRFFAAGRGVFYMHMENRVFAALCGGGDFISIPAGVRHWFDMGSRPDFTCLRVFTAPDGWVGRFTGSDIAARIPDFDALTAESP